LEVEGNMKARKIRTMSALVSAMMLSMTLLAVSAARAQEPPRTVKPGEKLQTAKVLGVQAHPEGRPFDYVNNASLTQIYDDYPYYDITLQAGDKQYVVRYDNMGGYYPSAWKPGSEVNIHKDDGGISILRYDGVLVPVAVLQTSSTKS
jgi:hypothetical protein